MVAGAGLCAGTFLVSDGVAGLYEGRVLEARDHVANLTHAKLVKRGLQRALAAHAIAEEGVTERHHAQVVALFDGAVKDAHRGHYAAVLVKVGVQDEGLERCLGIPPWRRDKIDDGLEKVMNPLAGLARDKHCVIGRDGKVLLDLLLNLLGVSGGKVDLVDGRHNVQVGVHGQRGI